MPTELRAARPDDAAPIRALMQRVITATVAPDTLADALANVNGNVDIWLAQPQRCLHLVALRAGTIVGVVLVKDHWNLCSLFVEQHLHGRGIGRQLMDAAIVACRPLSPKQALILNAAPSAIGFYRRLGFEEHASLQVLPHGILPMRLPL